jgi:MFS transporter, DHA2 family, multidrug resistance protein
VTSIALPAARPPLARSEIYRARYLISFAVALASVLELVDTSIVNVALPTMMGNLGATLAEISWVSTGYIVANVIVLPLTSWLADRFGRRNYYVGSIALFTIASYLCGQASTLEGLVFWRVVQGVGGGALISTAQAIIFDVFPPDERAIGMAIFGISVMVGPALGPTLGGWITENFSWPWIFYINLPLGILAGSLCWRLVPEPESKLHRSPSIDWLGVALLALGIGSLQVLLERGGAHDWFQSTEIRVEAALAAFGVIAFIWHELTTEHPIVDLRILKNRQLAAGMAFGAALGFALYASVFALPVFVQNVVGLGPEETGWIMLPGALASAVTMAVMGRINNKVDVRGLIALGIGIFFVAMLLHSRFTSEVGAADISFPLILRGIGLGMIFPPLTAAAIADLRPAQYGQGTGLYSLARQLGGSFGIAAIATVVTRYTEHAREALRTHLNPAEPATMARIEGLTRKFMTVSASAEQASARAWAALDYLVRKQAAVIAFDRVFLLMGGVFLTAIPLLLLFKTGRLRGSGAAGH